MQRLPAILLLVVSMLLVVAAWRHPGEATATAPPDNAEPEPFVVHEWGTFTTFSGADGVRLDFRPLQTNDLPSFVLDRFEQSGQLQPFYLKGRIRARVRMETPVTYFYTDRERDVSVRVGFPQGLLTEFYPPVAHMEPPFSLAANYEGEKIGHSLLDWGKVHLIPLQKLRTHVNHIAAAAAIESRIPAALVPPALWNDHYVYARETDSALIHVDVPADTARPTLPVGPHFEKFLFYRGVGNFELPLRLDALGQGQYRLTNSGKDAIRSLFLVTVHQQQITFNTLAELPANSVHILGESTAQANIETLGEAVVQALLREKLYEKEARAMVKTWSSSWFGEEGTRLFYVVPRPLTDAVLPLTIEPAPDQLERVLVGRMEILDPEMEARLLAVVRRSIESRRELAQRQADETTGQSAGSYRIPAELLTLGRLAEPALVRLQHVAKDSTVRVEAELLLAELHIELDPTIERRPE